MAIRVEFYGVARLRAGVSAATVESSNTSTLGEIFTAIRQRFPALAEHCFDEQRLHPTFVANIDGNQFVRDPATPLQPNSVVLLLSADAGG